MSNRRIRRIGSIKSELVCKSREAALAAVQIFNNPNISFKAESYIVLMMIAWTYLLHAYYRSQKIEHRYFKDQGNRRKFDRTKKGAYKYWELERCLNDDNSPIDKDTANNLRFMIGLMWFGNIAKTIERFVHDHKTPHDQRNHPLQHAGRLQESRCIVS
jgi:hypothetical protein